MKSSITIVLMIALIVLAYNRTMSKPKEGYCTACMAR